MSWGWVTPRALRSNISRRGDQFLVLQTSHGIYLREMGSIHGQRIQVCCQGTANDHPRAEAAPVAHSLAALPLGDERPRNSPGPITRAASTVVCLRHASRLTILRSASVGVRRSRRVRAPSSYVVQQRWSRSVVSLRGRSRGGRSSTNGSDDVAGWLGWDRVLPSARLTTHVLVTI